MKKKLLLIVLAIAMAFTITGCGKKNSPEEMLKEAADLDWPNLSKAISQNPAYSENFNGHMFYYYTTVDKILEDHCIVGKDSPVKVYLTKETLKELTIGKRIMIVGKLEDVQNTPKLTDAIVLDNEAIKNNFIFAIEETSGPGRKNKCKNYVVNQKTNLITSFRDSSGDHILTYDEKGNLIEDRVDKGILYGIEVTTYTYNDDNTVATEAIAKTKDGVTTPGNTWNYKYEKDEKNRVIKETSVNVSSDDKYTMIYEYEYDENDRVIQKTEISPRSTYIIKYEYDEFGNKIKEVAHNINKPYSEMITNHTYIIIAKKN